MLEWWDESREQSEGDYFYDAVRLIIKKYVNRTSQSMGAVTKDNFEESSKMMRGLIGEGCSKSNTLGSQMSDVFDAIDKYKDWKRNLEAAISSLDIAYCI